MNFMIHKINAFFGFRWSCFLFWWRLQRIASPWRRQRFTGCNNNIWKVSKCSYMYMYIVPARKSLPLASKKECCTTYIFIVVIRRHYVLSKTLSGFLTSREGSCRIVRLSRVVEGVKCRREALVKGRTWKKYEWSCSL